VTVSLVASLSAGEGDFVQEADARITAANNNGNNDLMWLLFYLINIDDMCSFRNKT
jgi:hypothetical protein